MEGLVSNFVEIPVDIQDVEIFLDMENLQDLEAQHHTQNIIKPSEQEKNHTEKNRKYMLTYFNTSC